MSQQYRIPLAGSYNTRVASTNVLTSDSGVVGIGVVGVMVVGKTGTTTTKDQRFVNCFTERVVNGFTGKTTLYLVKRPGFAASMTPQSGSIGTALLIWTGNAQKIISAFGATNSSIYDSTTRLVTNNTDTTVITGKATGIVETELSGTATLYISSSDNTGWYYQPSGTVTKISDAGFPGNNGFTLAGFGAAMDGYMFQMTTDGKLCNSDVNSIVNWTATSFVTANSYPDMGIGCVRKGDKIMAFGTESIQFYYNAGNASGSPLSRIEPMTMKIGCVHADAVCTVGDTVFWAGSPPEGGISIHSYGAGYQRVSTPEIDSILTLAGTTNITLATGSWYGRHFVVVRAGANSFCYCVEEKAWFELSSPTPLWYKSSGVSSGSPQLNYWVSNQSTSGKIYVINPASLVFEDDGVAYTATVQTSLLGEDSRRTFWHSLGLEFDVQSTTSTLTVSSNDADYGEGETVVRGTIDMSETSPRPIRRLGAAYRRAYILTHSANTPMRISVMYGEKSTAVA